MDNLTSVIFDAAFYITLLSLVLGFIRFMKGPTFADRTVALDGMTTSAIVVIIFVAMLTGRVIYVDVGMVYALLSFLGVIAVGRYLEGGL